MNRVGPPTTGWLIDGWHEGGGDITVDAEVQRVSVPVHSQQSGVNDSRVPVADLDWAAAVVGAVRHAYSPTVFLLRLRNALQ